MEKSIPSTMKAAALFGANDIRIIDCPVPEISDYEILLKTGAAAVCGSDLRMIGNGYKGVDENHPLVLGHEFAGTVVKVGSKVRGYSVGNRLSVAPNFGCGTCEHCSRGDTHLCSEYQAFGINMNGAFAQYVRIPREVIRQGNLIPISDEVSLDTAAIIEPLSCVLNGQSLTGIRLNDTVLLVGAGPIGVMHAMLARALGAAKVIVSDLSESRMDRCTELVSNCVKATGDLKEFVYKETQGKGADVCIIACPSPDMQAKSLELMAMNGRILYFGGLPAGKDMVQIPTNLIHYRQLSIHGSTRGNVSQYRDSVRLLDSGTLPLEKLVSGRFALEDFMQAVAHSRSAEGMKSVITFE